MGVFARTVPVGSGRLRIEGPTWVALAGCYGLWGMTLWQAEALGWAFAVPAAVLVAFHSSLQHEILHGHPTRSAVLNEALVFLPLGLFIPYRRFRELHLRHHNDSRLTDPYDDPESFYLAERAWGGAGTLTRAVLWLNGTFAGRMLIGPALALWAFWRSEARLVAEGDRAVVGAWLRHAVGLVPVLLCVRTSGLEVWAYAILAAYPGMSLIMVRSYIEHRATEAPAERTAIVEASSFWRLLFLNNNYHAVHHANPTLAWYLIPECWRADRAAVLARNGGYYIPGYGAVARRWLLRPREPVVHPLAHRSDTGQDQDA